MALKRKHTHLLLSHLDSRVLHDFNKSHTFSNLRAHHLGSMSQPYSLEGPMSVPLFYSPLMYTITVMNTLVTIVTVWVIIRHSPPSMATYKWFLLNIAIVCYVFDTFMTVIADPVPLFPAIGACVTGWIARDYRVSGVVCTVSQPLTQMIGHSLQELTSAGAPKSAAREWRHSSALRVRLSTRRSAQPHRVVRAEAGAHHNGPPTSRLWRTDGDADAPESTGRECGRRIPGTGLPLYLVARCVVRIVFSTTPTSTTTIYRMRVWCTSWV